jgi:hypothetical protein
MCDGDAIWARVHKDEFVDEFAATFLHVTSHPLHLIADRFALGRISFQIVGMISKPTALVPDAAAA